MSAPSLDLSKVQVSKCNQELIRMRDCLLKVSRELGDDSTVNVTLYQTMVHLYDEFGDESVEELETLIAPFNDVGEGA